MEQPLDNLSQPPVESTTTLEPTSKFKFSIWSFVIVGVALGGYLIASANQNLWPFRVDETVISSAPIRHKAVNTDTSNGSTLLTSNWKTYRNDKYGFEVKYPADYILKKSDRSFRTDSYLSGEGIYLNPQHSTAIFDIELFKNQKNLELQQWYEQILRGNEFSSDPGSGKSYDPTVDHISSTSVNGISSLRVFTEWYGYPKERYFFSKNNFIVEIETDIETDEMKNLTKLLLSTFKFIEPISQIDTSTWKTYRNDKYGFEFKYPDWIIENQGKKDIAFKYQGIDYNQENPLPLEVTIENTKFTNISDWFNSTFGERLKTNPNDMPQKTPINVNGITALNYKDPIQFGDVTAQIAVIKNFTLYTLTFSIEQKKIDQILSTFKFTK